MANFQNRKSTAPPPPPLSQLWQMSAAGNPSYSNSYHSDNDTHSINHEVMDDEEMNKLLAKNGDPFSNIHRKSISKQYSQPKPPLHASQAIVNETPHNFDDIVKNNPYKSKKIISSNNHKKRIIRPINAQYYLNGDRSNNRNISSNHHTIVRMHHHKKESKTIDAFLRNRMPESELQNRQILPSNIESNDGYNKGQQFWQQKQKEKEVLKTNLNRKLNTKFRPQQHELYNRGIYVTDPSV